MINLRLTCQFLSKDSDALRQLSTTNKILKLNQYKKLIRHSHLAGMERFWFYANDVFDMRVWNCRNANYPPICYFIINLLMLSVSIYGGIVSNQRFRDNKGQQYFFLLLLCLVLICCTIIPISTLTPLWYSQRKALEKKQIPLATLQQLPEEYRNLSRSDALARINKNKHSLFFNDLPKAVIEKIENNNKKDDHIVIDIDEEAIHDEFASRQSVTDTTPLLRG